MIEALLTAAFAGGPTAQATVETETVGGRRNLDTAVHVGLDLRGASPGLGARLDLGHRVSVTGVMFAGAPTAERLKWTGGASLGLELAPIRVQLGTHGSIDFRLGAGGVVSGSGIAKMQGGGLDFAEWAAGTLHVSPNGRWTLYGGLLASELLGNDSKALLQPNTGVKFKID